MLYGSGQQYAQRFPKAGHTRRSDCKKRRAFIKAVEYGKGQRLDDPFKPAAITPDPKALPETRDKRERHTLPGVILRCGVPVVPRHSAQSSACALTGTTPEPWYN